MARLPSGTVTFLFTDIEGSTRLLHHLGQHRYDELLTAHHEILTAAFVAHEGRVVDTQGDSFFVAFRTAADAVAAAADAQRDLAAHPWLEGAEVKVRMGLHTGEPKLGEERYVGIGVHRAARIGAAGHGGQVLLSWTTKGLAEEDLPAGVTVRDLGERRLKDIEQPQRLYQLAIEGLPDEFGPLKTLDVELARKRRRMYAGAALIGVLAAAVAIPLFALGQGGSGGGITVQGNAVAEIDPGSNKVVGQVANVGARPSSIAYGSGSLWVANLDDQTVARIDPSSRSVTKSVPVVNTPTDLATSLDSVWVVGATANSPSVIVRRIDPQFDTVSALTSISNVDPGGPGSVAAQGRTLWIAPSSGLLSRLDPKTSRVVQRIDPNAAPSSVAIGAGAVWVADSEANSVTRIDVTGLLTPIAVGHGPTAIAAGAGAIWVVDSLDSAVVRIDPATRAPTKTIPVGLAPSGIAVGTDSVWVANSGDGTITRFDPTGAKKRATIRVGGSPQAIAFANGRVWVTADRRAPEQPASGGTARLSSEADVDSMDPALAYETSPSWQLEFATCAQLLNYPDTPAPGGSRLVPEVAESLPARSTDGKTYTFAIRNGFRFSPPSDQPVTAQTFKYSIERSLSPVMKGPAQGFLGDVVGAKEYMAGKAPHISGILAHGKTLTIRLVAPAPDLVTRIAVPFFCAVPIGTPFDPRGVRLVPSAGPYYVASYTPKQGVVLRRNPNYHGSRPHHLSRIALAVGIPEQKSVAQTEAGAADYAMDSVSTADISGLRAHYGSRSPAAARGRQQFFLHPQLTLLMLVLNTNRPLFRSPALRRAVNYAIDRNALALIGDPFLGNELTPTDQYVPPGMPGFRDFHVYPRAPMLAEARRLVGGTSRTAVLYTCNLLRCAQAAQVVKNNLAAIGISLEVKAFPTERLFARLERKDEPFDLFQGGWTADYPDPANFLNAALLDPKNGYGMPFSDPAAKRKLTVAARLSGPARYLAYDRLDADLTRNTAPWVAYGNGVSADFFSARMGCQVFQPARAFMDLAALCIRKKS